MPKLRGRRVESPSSINIYKQCPRRYYYQYVEKLQTSTSIHLIRGSLAHSVLEDFFDVEIHDPETQSFRFLLLRLLSLFKKYWAKNKADLEALGLAEGDLQFYFDETTSMLQNWFTRFKNRVSKRMEVMNIDLKQAFLDLKPIREEEYASEEFMVRGFVDIIYELDGKTFVMDYKTSKNDHISDAYRLQLAIYALLYEEKTGRRPDFVGIDFLKSIEKMLPVDEELIQHAKFELEQIHSSTTSDDICDYPQNPSPLCKWKSGQCDFYEVCFGGMSIPEFHKKYPKRAWKK